LQALPKERVLVAAPFTQVPLIREQLPTLPDNAIIVEPVARDTGAGSCFVTAKILARDPDALIATFCTDHLIERIDEFVSSLHSSFLVAAMHPSALILHGAPPTRIHTGLGYIQKGDIREQVSSLNFYSVSSFIEKPDPKTADRLLRARALWNTGTRIYKAAPFIAHARTVVPRVLQAVDALVHASTIEERAEAVLQFKNLEKRSFEYYFSNSLEYLVLEIPYLWSDLGDWKAVYEALRRVGDEHEALRVMVESQDSMVIGSKKLVALFGVKDVLIVDTDDALLVVDRNRGRDIRALVAQVEAQGLSKYL
jgi:mannose-1-phosphate guanylyltransferase